MSPERGRGVQGREELRKRRSEGEEWREREREVAKEGPGLLTEAERMNEEPAKTEVGAERVVERDATPFG